MQKIFQLLAFLLLSAPAAFSQASEATLLGNWHDDDLILTSWLDSRYNEVWGFAINGHEYAVIGSTEGMHIIDVTNPANPEEAFRVDGAAIGPNLVHRDFKTFNGYLYCVADEGSASTLQIVDLNDLPNSITEVYNSNEFVITAHNLYIDETQARLYLVGAQGKTKVLDISTPDQPVLLGSYPDADYFMPYVHDAYIADHIGFFNCGNQGFWVIDFTDPQNPQTISTLTNYVDAGYNHSGWVSEDGKYYFLLDETHGMAIKVIDITDLENLQVVATMEPGNWNDEIAHNAIVRGDLLFVSYYYDGLQVWDISNPLEPVRVYYYDTYPGQNETFFAGAWGVYPLLPSGNVLVSDMQGGLFVVEALPDPVNLTLLPGETEFEICAGETITFELTLGGDFSPNGVNLSIDPGSTPATVAFNPNPAMPGSTVTVTVSDVEATGGNVGELIILADDGVNSNAVSVFVMADLVPEFLSYLYPLPSDVPPVSGINFEWMDVDFAESYKLQIATDPADFDNSLVYSASTTATSFPLPITLDPATTYHWRVVTTNACGQDVPASTSFTTEGANAVTQLDGRRLDVFPNPAKARLTVSLEQSLGETLQLEMTSITGQQVLRQEILAGENTALLNVSPLPSGVYFLKISSENDAVVRRVIVQ